MYVGDIVCLDIEIPDIAFAVQACNGHQKLDDKDRCTGDGCEKIKFLHCKISSLIFVKKSVLCQR